MRAAGRPKKNDVVPRVSKVTFLLDAVTDARFECLGAEAGLKIRGWRSILLRRLINEAFEKLNQSSD